MNYVLQKFDELPEEKLKSLWLELVQDEEGADLNIVPSEENASRWLKFVKNIVSAKKGNLVAARVDEAICGYIFYSWNSSPLETRKKVGMIYDLYVVPEFRNRGLGTALLQYALNDMQSNGAQLVRLTVLSNNKKAISLYRKLGFAERLKSMELSLQN
ncbi:MAG: GNAT family N-acetyltransferase [Euryarchaeota archaeon]|nr:GNAT family N-acetyltransferase [Euryarchaeota archaeon]